jgi:fructose-specific phosphotransferase system component IIB
MHYPSMVDGAEKAVLGRNWQRDVQIGIVDTLPQVQALQAAIQEQSTEVRKTKKTQTLARTEVTRVRKRAAIEASEETQEELRYCIVMQAGAEAQHQAQQDRLDDLETQLSVLKTSLLDGTHDSSVQTSPSPIEWDKHYQAHRQVYASSIHNSLHEWHQVYQVAEADASLEWLQKHRPEILHLAERDAMGHDWEDQAMLAAIDTQPDVQKLSAEKQVSELRIQDAKRELQEQIQEASHSPAPTQALLREQNQYLSNHLERLHEAELTELRQHQAMSRLRKAYLKGKTTLHGRPLPLLDRQSILRDYRAARQEAIHKQALQAIFPL